MNINIMTNSILNGYILSKTINSALFSINRKIDLIVCYSVNHEKQRVKYNIVLNK